MKLKFHFIMMAVAILMAGCSDDDEPVYGAEDIVGTYKGYTIAEFKYSQTPMITTDESISFTAIEDGTANISFESATWGTFTINRAEVNFTNNNYNIKGSGITLMGMDGEAKEYDCTIEGTISRDKKTVSLVFNVPAVMGGLKITFINGDAPAAMLIAGNYKGALDVSVSGNPLSEEKDFTLTIKAQENGKVEIALADFGTENMNLTGVVIPDIEVSAIDGGYALEGVINTTSGTSPITGSMEGTIIDGKADFIFNFRPGGMPMDIVATFTM